MTSTYLAAAAEQNAGWGRLAALTLTALMFWAFTAGHKRWKQVKDVTPSKTHSPEPAAITVTAVKPQVTAGMTVDQGGDAPGRAVVVRPGPSAPQKRDDDMAEFIRLRTNTVGTTQLVREVQHQFNVSPATAWRAVRRVRNSTEKQEAGTP